MIRRTLVRFLNFLFCRKRIPRVLPAHHSSTSSLNTSVLDAEKSKVLAAIDFESRLDGPVGTGKADPGAREKCRLRIFTLAGRRVSICREISRDATPKLVQSIRKNSTLNDYTREESDPFHTKSPIPVLPTTFTPL